MCGITGWVDFSRDLEQHAPLLAAMTDTLALRGPDASGSWRGPAQNSCEHRGNGHSGLREQQEQVAGDG